MDWDRIGWEQRSSKDFGDQNGVTLRYGRLSIILYFVSHQSAAVCHQFRRSIHTRCRIFAPEKHQKTFGGRAPTGPAGELLWRKDEWKNKGKGRQGQAECEKERNDREERGGGRREGGVGG